VPSDGAARHGRPMIQPRTPEYARFLTRSAPGSSVSSRPPAGRADARVARAPADMEAAVANHAVGRRDASDRRHNAARSRSADAISKGRTACQIASSAAPCTARRDARACARRCRDHKTQGRSSCSTASRPPGCLHGRAGLRKVPGHQFTTPFLIVAAVLGLGIGRVRMDAWAIDVVVSASRRGIMTGRRACGIVALTERRGEWPRASSSPKFYLDLAEERK